jgi:adenylate kinase
MRDGVYWMNIIFFGPPGTGKGTIAQYINRKFGYQHISSGDLLRDEVKKKTKIGRQIAPLIKDGKLVEDEIIADIVSKKVKGLSKTGFILDGYPRNINQASMFEKFLQKSKIKIDFVLNIDSKESKIIERLSARRQCTNCKRIFGLDVPPIKDGVCDDCKGQLIQREDDRPEVVKYRLELYKVMTEPVIEFFEKRDLLITIDGNEPLHKIFNKVEKLIMERMK